MNEAMIKFSQVYFEDELTTRPVHPEHVAIIEEGIALGDYPEPLLVCEIGPGRYMGLGGRHRYEAWRRALRGADSHIKVRVIEAKDKKARMSAAVADNIGQPWGYTMAEIGRLYQRLRREFGFSKHEAHKLLRLTEEHAERMEPPVVMKATSAVLPESPERSKRAGGDESLVQQERAVENESPARVERAVSPESSNQQERAAQAESPDQGERAALPESSGRQERAVVAESSVAPERAGPPESSKGAERAVPRESPELAERNRFLRYHVLRLSILLPQAWAAAHEALVNLDAAITASIKREEKR